MDLLLVPSVWEAQTDLAEKGKMENSIIEIIYNMTDWISDNYLYPYNSLAELI